MATDTAPPSNSEPSLQPTSTILPTPSATATATVLDPPPPTATATATATPTPTSVTPRPPEPDAEIIHIPSYSRWFSWNAVHECEVRFVPEFFDGRSSSKNPRVYKSYRNAIIRRFRENPTRKITFTEVRKTIVGDVGSVRRVFDFLEAWGLINFTGSNLKQHQLKWEDKETKSANATAQGGDALAGGGSGATDVTLPKKRLCSGCKTPCTIACFASDKHDMILCARCYVRGNYRVGLSSSDFKRVEISEEAKTDWTDKETLQLLEAVMHYGDDWKKVAEHVGGKTVKECVARFLKLPFGEQFDGPPDSAEVDAELGLQNVATLAKRMRLSPLADASNPIMAQEIKTHITTLSSCRRKSTASLPISSTLHHYDPARNVEMESEKCHPSFSVPPGQRKMPPKFISAPGKSALHLDEQGMHANGWELFCSLRGDLLVGFVVLWI